MPLQFRSKAEVLEDLEGRLQHSVVLSQVRFSVAEWRRSRLSVIERIRQKFGFADHLIVRSSSLSEDSLGSSLAGRFESAGHILGEKHLEDAVESVIRSLGNQSGLDQVFVQRMLTDVLLSGVIFTRDPRNGGHYYVINYEEGSGYTDVVTSGRGDCDVVYYHSKTNDGEVPANIARMLAMARELEGLYEDDSLDIEFAVSREDELVLLQVRPLLCVSAEGIECPAEDQARSLNNVYDAVKRMSGRHPYLCGDRTIFGTMPDWNPAEIIGCAPKPLALSLYRELVTDNIWAFQRDNYGYRNLRSFPLMVDFEGAPYIDVRVSLNSFVPKSIDDELAEKLVNYYLAKLVRHPELHDKIETDIVLSAFTFDLREKVVELQDHGFSESECEQIVQSLVDLTEKIVSDDRGVWRKDIAKLDELKVRQVSITQSSMTPLQKIYWLIEDCKRYGTLPFAGLARGGFIAMDLLRSLVRVGIFSTGEFDAFLLSADSIHSKMLRDLDQLDKADFLAIYGHLRPGTYDVTSKRYDEDPDRYFQWNRSEEGGPTDEKPKFELRPEQVTQIDGLFQSYGFETNAHEIMKFIKSAIEAREYAKFVFTRSLSDVLVILERFAGKLGISREDTAYMDVASLMRLYSASGFDLDMFRLSIGFGKDRHRRTQAIALPPLIFGPEDVYSFRLPKSIPNFVTMKSVVAAVATEDSEDISGKIVMITSADPGYDWIFAHGIAGFVTMYGGRNSHMAIRANELGIPAVIGAGESLFRKWERASVLALDCAGCRVDIVQ